MGLKFFKSWLVSRASFILYLFICLGLTCLFSYVFDRNGELILYYLSLLLIVALIYLGFDYRRDYKKYRQLVEGRQVNLVGLSPSEGLLLEQLEEARQAYQALQAIERGKSEQLMDYFTLWAHQIKIPLTASKLLIQELPDKHGLDQELFKLEQYADLAMNYLRLENFHDDLLLVREDLQSLVRQAVKKYALFFIQKKLSLDLAEFDYPVVTDKKWLAIILEQVLSNSLKYTQEGGIAIYLEGDELVIADTGIGIQASDLNRVFERGFSGFNGRVSQQSSGLGLYLSKTIADRLGHRLTLTSQLGQGTQVRLGLQQSVLAED